MGYGGLADALHQAEEDARGQAESRNILALWQDIGNAFDRATSTQSEAPLKSYIWAAQGAPAQPPTQPNEPPPAQLQPQTAPANNAATAMTHLRIDVDRLETMFETVGQLQTRLQILSQAEYGSQSWEREMRNVQSLATRSVHHIASVRLSSLKPLATLFERALQEASVKSAKPVQFFARGGNLRIAREVVERLRPLIPHIARNAVAHGIEDPDIRQKLGKPVHGNVEFSAMQDGATVVLHIRDDGGGIDLVKLRAKAKALGLGERLSEQELFGLLFRSGFSTKTETNQISGRGVGLDAVKEAVASAGGSIAIRQEQGRFFELQLRIPVPLSQQRVIEVDLNGIPFGILDEDWQETLTPPGQDMRALAFPGLTTPIDGTILTSGKTFFRVRTWRSIGSVHIHRLAPPLDRMPGAVGFYLDETGTPRIVFRGQ